MGDTAEKKVYLITNPLGASEDELDVLGQVDAVAVGDLEDLDVGELESARSDFGNGLSASLDSSERRLLSQHAGPSNFQNSDGNFLVKGAPSNPEDPESSQHGAVESSPWRIGRDVRTMCSSLVGSVVRAGMSTVTWYSDKKVATPKPGDANDSSDSGEFLLGLDESPTAKIEAPELPNVEPIPILVNVRDYLNSDACTETYGVSFTATTPNLFSVGKKLRDNRNKAEIKKEALAFFHTVFGNINCSIDYYNKVNYLGLYDSFFILLENVATLFFGEEYLQQLEKNGKSPYLYATLYLLSRMEKGPDGGFQVVTKQKFPDDYKGNFLELAAGNCSISKRLFEAYDGLKFHIGFEQETAQRPTRKRLQREANEDANRVRTRIDGKRSSTRRIAALDNYWGFKLLAQNKNVAGIEASLCLSTDEFFKETGLTPNSIDTLTLVLAIDRIEDLEQAMVNIRHLAREDGSSKILLGFYLPLENVASTKTKDPAVKKLKFFNAEEDLRSRWMKGNTDNLPDNDVLVNGLDEKEERTEARMLADFLIEMKKRFGMDLISLGSQPYEIISPHCAVAKAGEMRSDYTKEELECGEPEIDHILDDVFAKNSPYSDDAIIVLPERINRLYTCAFRIEPLNGDKYRKNS